MMMFTKRSLLAIAVFALSLSVNAADQQCSKGAKQVDDCGQSAQKDDCGQSAQTGQTCQTSQSDTCQADSKQSDCGQSSQFSSQTGASHQSGTCSQYGAQIQSDSCSNRAGHHHHFSSQAGLRSQLSSWAGEGQACGSNLNPLTWRYSVWNNVRIVRSAFGFIDASDVKLTNVWLHGNFDNVNFRNSEFSDVTLSGRMNNTDFPNGTFNNVLITDANLVQDGVHRNNFDDMKINNSAIINSSVNHATFRDTDFNNVLIENSELHSHIRMGGAKLKDVTFRNVKIRDWSIFKKVKVFVRNGSCGKSQSQSGEGGKWVKLDKSTRKSLQRVVEHGDQKEFDLGAIIAKAYGN